MAEVDETREEARRNTRGRFEQWAKNPSCEANVISAVHNVRLDKAAEKAGLKVSFGQSPFALARGNAFEAGLFLNNAQRIRDALEKKKVIPAGTIGLLDLRLKMNGGKTVSSVDDALAKTIEWFQDLADPKSNPAEIVASPMVKIPKGVILPEAILIIDVVTVTSASDGRRLVTVGEVKVFPDRGGHTDPHQVASARAQAGLYRRAFELAIDDLGIGDRVAVSPTGFLVFTWPGSNQPSIRANEDLTYQAVRAERGFARLEEIAAGIVREEDWNADLPQLIDRVLDAPTEYSEACLSFCDLAPRCHARALATDDPVVLGDDVKRLLGDLPLTRALALLNGATPVDDRETDLQRQFGVNA